MGALHRLKAKQVQYAEPGMHCDGGGLWLRQRKDGGQWILRFSIHGKRHDMGLGSSDAVSLSEARLQAEKWRAVVRDNKNPIKERDRERREAARPGNTLNAITRDAFEARKAELKNDGKAGRWMSPLELHVLPKIGAMPVEDIDQREIKTTLAPIWHSKADTARKAMNRLNLVLKHAAAMGLDVDLQATEKARALLGKSRHKVKHIPAMSWPDVPAFYASLNEGSVTHLALRLLILTAVRSGPIRFCRADQIEGQCWSIPAENIKTSNDFRVPLSGAALGVIEEVTKFSRDGFLFPSVRKGVISDATMARLMERRGLEERPHGFRSSFRNWCAETESASWEVAEYALGHSVGNKIERSYKTTDFFDARMTLMETWAAHVTSKLKDKDDTTA